LLRSDRKRTDDDFNELFEGRAPLIDPHEWQRAFPTVQEELRQQRGRQVIADCACVLRSSNTVIKTAALHSQPSQICAL
jgi:hypothetical protein